MKTIEEIKKEVAIKHGNIGICIPNSKLDIVINEAMREYAKQCCEEQIKACAEKYDNDNGEIHECSYDVILNTPNVAE